VVAGSSPVVLATFSPSIEGGSGPPRMSPLAIAITIAVALSLAGALIAIVFWIRRLATRSLEEAKGLARGALIAADPMASYLSRSDRGLKQAKGNCSLVLSEKTLVSIRWVPKEVTVDREEHMSARRSSSTSSARAGCRASRASSCSRSSGPRSPSRSASCRAKRTSGCRRSRPGATRAASRLNPAAASSLLRRGAARHPARPRATAGATSAPTRPRPDPEPAS